MSDLCKKCGVVFDRNSNRQKYCRGCSPHFPRVLRREKTCAYCKKKYGQAKSNQIYGITDNPCPNCRGVRERQNKARERKYQKGWNKYLSHYSKWLLSEKNRDNIHYFTLSRWVSENELNRIKRNGGVSGESVGVAVFRDTCYCDVEEYIYRPGFYRCENTGKDDRFFRVACAGGLPLNSNNSCMQWYNAAISKDSFEKSLDHKQLRYMKRIAEKLIVERKKQWDLSANVDMDAGQFFAALCMAGSTKQKETQCK